MKYPKVRDVLNELKWYGENMKEQVVLPALGDVVLVVSDRVAGVKYVDGSSITRIGKREFDFTTVGDNGLNKTTTIPFYKVLVIRDGDTQIWERP